MKTYKLIYKCRNCGTRYEVLIPFGQEALINLSCPNCGRSACNPEKTEDYAITGYVIKDEQIKKVDSA